MLRKTNARLRLNLDKELSALAEKYRSLKETLVRAESKVRKERSKEEGEREWLRLLAQIQIDECAKCNAEYERQSSEKSDELSALTRTKEQCETILAKQKRLIEVAGTRKSQSSCDREPARKVLRRVSAPTKTLCRQQKRSCKCTRPGSWHESKSSSASLTANSSYC